MKKPIPIILVCCLVLAMGAPVSADFFIERCNADDFTNALVDYCNHSNIHNMTESEIELDNYDFRYYDVIRTNDSLDFKFECSGNCICWIPGIIPSMDKYLFSGEMHVDNPKIGLWKPYKLEIAPNSFRYYIATGPNWVLKVKNMKNTYFYR